MLRQDIYVVGEKRNGPAHILVVDDELHICQILEVNLQRAGYRVTCVHRLNAARVMIAKNHLDVVLLDMWLPGDPSATPLDTGFGFDLSGELRDDHTTAGLPVIMMAAKSAVADPYGRDRASWLDQQGRPYVFKPFNPMKILTLIKKVLEGGGAPDGAESLQDWLP